MIFFPKMSQNNLHSNQLAVSCLSYNTMCALRGDGEVMTTFTCTQYSIY